MHTIDDVLSFVIEDFNSQLNALRTTFQGTLIPILKNQREIIENLEKALEPLVEVFKKFREEFNELVKSLVRKNNELVRMAFPTVYKLSVPSNDAIFKDTAPRSPPSNNFIKKLDTYTIMYSPAVISMLKYFVDLARDHCAWLILVFVLKFLGVL